MNGQALEKSHVEGVTECWFRPDPPPGDPQAFAYRPAALIEFSVNFRSLRAGLNHSEERSYTAWLPGRDLAIDWDTPAVLLRDGSQVWMQPDPDIRHLEGDYAATPDDFAQFEAELVNQLARGERLRVFYNPVFGLFSAPEDRLEDFLARVAEAALGRIEPELRRLRNRFELQFEQIREKHAVKQLSDEDRQIKKVISHKLHLFESENRLAEMFSTLAGAVFGAPELRARQAGDSWEEAELREDLDRLEHEAGGALGALYGEYLTLANEYDVFEIGLQPDNIQVTRRLLLWVPVEQEPET